MENKAITDAERIIYETNPIFKVRFYDVAKTALTPDIDIVMSIDEIHTNSDFIAILDKKNKAAWIDSYIYYCSEDKFPADSEWKLGTVNSLKEYMNETVKQYIDDDIWNDKANILAAVNKLYGPVEIPSDTRSLDGWFITHDNGEMPEYHFEVGSNTKHVDNVILLNYVMNEDKHKYLVDLANDFLYEECDKYKEVHGEWKTLRVSRLTAYSWTLQKYMANFKYLRELASNNDPTLDRAKNIYRTLEACGAKNVMFVMDDGTECKENVEDTMNRLAHGDLTLGTFGHDTARTDHVVEIRYRNKPIYKRDE